MEAGLNIKRHNPGDILSDAVEYNGVVYLAGMVADDLTKDIKGQTEEVLKNIDVALAAAGTDKSKLLSANVYVADIRLRDQMNVAWKAWIDPRNPPARATVEAKMADPRMLVEIMCQCAK
jgi:enamine deaminase RidA (YjgF/YER057c/UK114 family)